MATETAGIAKRRVAIFSAGCKTCHRTIDQLREHIDPRHEIAVRDMHDDPAAAEEAEAFGIRTVPAVVVDGFLLACCKHKGPTLRELDAAAWPSRAGFASSRHSRAGAWPLVQCTCVLKRAPRARQREPRQADVTRRPGESCGAEDPGLCKLKPAHLQGSLRNRAYRVLDMRPSRDA